MPTQWSDDIMLHALAVLRFITRQPRYRPCRVSRGRKPIHRGRCTGSSLLQWAAPMTRASIPRHCPAVLVPRRPASLRTSARASTTSRRAIRVAYAGGPLGAYSEVRVMPADRLVALPQGISDQQGEPRSTRQGQGLVVVHDHLAAAPAGRGRFAGKAGRDWRALTVAGTGVNLSAPAKPNSQERPLRK
jgi:hypothetical protein